MRPLLIVVVLSLMSSSIRGQVAFQSASGETSVVIRDQGLLALNFAKGDFAVGGTFTVPGTNDLETGLVLKATPKGSFLGLLRGDSLTLQQGTATGLLTYYLGDRFKPTFFSEHFVSLGLNYTGAKYDLVRQADELAAPYAEEHSGWGVTGYYNAIMPGLFREGALLALSGGFGKRSNVAGFDRVQVCTTTPTADSTRIVQACKDYLLGEFSASSAWVANGDYLTYTGLADNRIVVGAYFRYDELAESKFRPGVGIYVTKADNLLSFIGGLTGEIIDGAVVAGLQVGIPLWGSPGQ